LISKLARQGPGTALGNYDMISVVFALSGTGAGNHFCLQAVQGIYNCLLGLG